MTLTRKILHVGATALMLSTVASVTTFVTADAAYAERGGNGNGNGNGRANRDRDRSETGNRGNGNGRGALASELKGLNAAHASQRALENASPDSMPGKLFVYQQASIGLAAATAAANEAQQAYNDLLSMDPLTYVPTEAYPTHESALAAAEAEAIATATVAATEQENLDTASATLGVDDLSEGALAELARLLGL